MSDSKKILNHPDIPIHSDTTIERAMRCLKETQDLETENDSGKALDAPVMDKMQRLPVVKK